MAGMMTVALKAESLLAVERALEGVEEWKPCIRGLGRLAMEG
jgi:hypothetical protein